MVQAIQASKVTLGELRQHFGLSEAENPQFFTEWLAIDSQLSEADAAEVSRVRGNFKYLLEEPPLLEEAVKMVVLARLLDLAAFYQPPFRIRPELGIEISSPAEDGAIVRGNIDVLVILGQLWVLAIEAKMTTFALNVALPQALSYMLSSPGAIAFGLLTNGAEFAFVKLSKEEKNQFAVSRTFSLYAPGNELAAVLKILRHLGQQIAQTSGRSQPSENL
ncbi:MAG: restriction endonuclease subunit R [Synechococcales cyanobacterium CRU_2_2]|nr:restriction endonuclease subunit R [Synechococcales cyanobacterium CRU_2_2]